MMISRTLRQGWLRIGGYLAHVGIAVLLVGVIGSYVYSSPDERMVIPQGETQRMFGHDFTFWGYESRPDGKHGLRLEVDRESQAPFVALPEIFYNSRMQTWVRTPAIKRTLWKDLYIAPEEFKPADDPNTATLTRSGEDEIGPFRVRFDAFKIEDHMTADQRVSVGATLTITRENEVQVLTPWLRVSPEGMISSLPVPMGNGKDLILEQISVNTDQVRVRIAGLNLPVAPARAVVTVSTKPAIALVWLGTIVMVIGGVLAALRRRQELLPVPIFREPQIGLPTDRRPRGWGRSMPGWRGVIARWQRPRLS
jgi:cytochrome c-type biogenesis protein CcmF